MMCNIKIEPKLCKNTIYDSTSYAHLYFRFSSVLVGCSAFRYNNNNNNNNNNNKNIYIWYNTAQFQHLLAVMPCICWYVCCVECINFSLCCVYVGMLVHRRCWRYIMLRICWYYAAYEVLAFQCAAYMLVLCCIDGSSVSFGCVYAGIYMLSRGYSIWQSIEPSI